MGFHQDKRRPMIWRTRVASERQPPLQIAEAPLGEPGKAHTAEE